LKFILLIIFFFIQTNSAFPQDSTGHIYTRNVLWTTPVKRNTIINGIAIGFAAMPWKNANLLKINGLNLEIQPFGIIAGMYALGGTISSLSNPEEEDSVNRGGGDLVSRNIFTEKDEFNGANINGVSLSLGGISRQTKISGLAVNGIICFVNRMDGVEITGIMNLHYEFNGVMISGFRNKVTKGQGLQIGLINTCRSGRVLQLGLINRIGKRVTPILNFSFKKR
jgi:hypothetical protein